jgi:putative peptidoglycan lipid II flippase
MFPFILFISMAALTTAVLNAYRRFVGPAAAPVLFNVAVIGIVLAWAHRAQRPSLVFAVGTVVGGLLQWAVQWPILRRLGFTPAWQLDFRHPGLREVFRLMGPGFFAVGIAQINMAIGQSYASTLGQGAVAALTYASRVQELTIGMIAVAFSTVLLPHLSDLAARGDWHRFRASVTEGVVWVLAWNLAAAVGLMWLSAPIVHALFEYGRFNVESRLLSAGALVWYALATPAYSLNKVPRPGFLCRQGPMDADPSRRPLDAGLYRESGRPDAPVRRYGYRHEQCRRRMDPDGRPAGALPAAVRMARRPGPRARTPGDGRRDRWDGRLAGLRRARLALPL